MPMYVLNFLVSEIRYRWKIVKESKDAGYSTETVIGVALLAVLAIAVLGIIYTKVTAKADSINLDGEPGDGGGTGP